MNKAQIIERHKVISFDLFDTLINREISRPKNIFKVCEQEFINFQHTDLLQMLQNMRKKLNSFSKWYGDSLDEDLDEKIIDKYLAGFGKVKDAYITLDYLEKAIKAGEINNSKVRGDAKVNPYELVR